MIVLANINLKAISLKARPLLGFLLFFSGCGNERNQFTINGNTMGTTYSIKFVSSTTNINIESIESGIDSLLNQLNKQMSTWDPKSEISLFNSWKSLEPYPVSEALLKVMNGAIDISRKTDGLFDITVYELMRLWGFGPNPKSGMPDNNEIISALNRSGYGKITIKNETLIKSDKSIKVDLNAIAKGYGVDKVFAYVRTKGYEDIFVEIGGEVRCSGKTIMLGCDTGIYKDTYKRIGKEIGQKINLVTLNIGSWDFRKIVQIIF